MMKLLIIATSLIYVTVTAQKIEVKAKEIKAKPHGHNIEDVYSLLFKSIDLNKQQLVKTDSSTRALKDVKKSYNEINKNNAQMLILLTELQSGDHKYSEQMHVVQKFIDSVIPAFCGIVVFFVLGIIIKRSHSIAI
jgi:hypothetical protein